jgi:hypothetical protein
MITPSGRFAVLTKICMSMSDFHPELWNPAWTVRTILVGMLSFMNTEELTTGGIRASEATRIQYARDSLTLISKDEIVQEIFPDIITLATSRLVEEAQRTWLPDIPLPQSKSMKSSDALKETAKDVSGDGAKNQEEESADEQIIFSETKPSKSSKRNAAKRRAKAKQKESSNTSTPGGCKSSTSDNDVDRSDDHNDNMNGDAAGNSISSDKKEHEDIVVTLTR